MQESAYEGIVVALEIESSRQTDLVRGAAGDVGFGADERRYDAAVEMLRHLKIDRVQLLTNNPEKVRALRDTGIRVIDRQPLYGTLNRHNLSYVKTKVHRAGHWLGEMLSGTSPGP